MKDMAVLQRPNQSVFPAANWKEREECTEEKV